MTDLEASLLDHLDAVMGYARKQVGDPDLAAEVVQESLAKALEAAPTLRDDDRVMPWFYRILNNTITDLYRRRGVEARYRPVLARAVETTVEPAEYAQVCRCLRALLPTLRPDQAALIEALELGDEDPQAVARRLGITRGALKVRRHRARRQLRQRLEDTCRACATHGCLDCSCKQGQRSRIL